MRFACPGTWERDTNYTNGHEPRDTSVNWFGSIRAGLWAEPMGIGDTEGKAATESGERAGKQASFKFVSRLPMSEGFRAFGVFRGQEDIRSRSWMRLSNDKERP